MNDVENSLVVDWWWERFENGYPLSEKEQREERAAHEEYEYGMHDELIRD